MSLSLLISPVPAQLQHSDLSLLKPAEQRFTEHSASCVYKGKRCLFKNALKMQFNLISMVFISILS